ncbi:hypothetical protein [Nostoc sp. CCY 9925]|uniref:hypothetical protein n=1 Tax=Nostoc sp. CCY 9925 TaxID=3103865 RepID=UPI0039C64008
MVFTETKTNDTATTNGSQGWAVDKVLNIRQLTDIDVYAQEALKATENWIVNDKWAEYKQQKNSVHNLGQTAKDTLPKYLSIEKIDELTKKLDNSGLEDIPRTLLSNSEIYAFILLQATESVNSDDVAGLSSAVQLRVSDLPKRYLLARILAEVTSDLQVNINPTQKRIVELTLEKGIDIRAGQVRSSVKKLLEILEREKNIPEYLEKYINERSALPNGSFNTTIRQLMVDYLITLGVNFTTSKQGKTPEELFKTGSYDEYFVLAYHEALKKIAVADDPIDTARIKGGEVTWNFTVDSFDAIDRQGVIPANIKAAGALDYIFNIGERMRVFDVANALVLRWASGMLDIPEGKTASALYRFHKLRNERNTPAERAMLYKRVLNKGNGKLLSKMVVNEAFPMLWHQLMAEVAEYIRKSERSKDVWVSKSPLFQATKNLQYNLTEHMTGMSHVQVTEDYAHLQEALEILRSEEILNSFGGRRKSLWSVIEQVAKEDLNAMVATATLRTIAVEGNKIFQWIAGFESEGAVRQADFDTLLSAAESWIIAQASMETGSNGKFLPQESASHYKTNTAHRSLPRGRDTVKPKRKGSDGDFDDWDV